MRLSKSLALFASIFCASSMAATAFGGDLGALEDRAVTAASHGDVDAAAVRYRRALLAALDEGSPRSRAMARSFYFGFLSNTLARERERAEIAVDLEALLPLLKDELLIARVRYDLADEYMRLDRPAQAKRMLVPLGILDAWAVVGSFDNERGAGWGVAYGPEQELDFKAEYKGKKWKVSWREVPVKRWDGYVDLNALMRPDDQSLAYAVTHVRSDKERAVDLLLSSDESVAVWVNGKKILDRRVKRKCGFDDDIVPAVLRAGWNRILVKIGEEEGDWGFRMRIANPGGAPLEKPLETRTGVEGGAPELGKPASLQAGPPTATAVDILEQHLRDNGADYRAAFNLAQLYVAEHHLDTASRRAMDLTRDIVRARGDFAPYHYAYSQAAQLSYGMAAERDENLRRHELERAIELDSAHVKARVALVKYYRRLGNERKARRVVRAALGENADYVPLRLLDAGLKGRRGWETEAQRLVRETAKAHPKNSRALVAYSAVLGAVGRTKEALALAHKRYRLNPSDPGARYALYEENVLNGNMEAALDYHDRHIAENPYALGAYLRKAEIQAGDNTVPGIRAAVATLERALAIAPEDSDALNALGKLYYRLPEGEGRTRAEVLWMRSMRYNPRQPRLREYIRFLKGGSHGFEEPYRKDVDALVKRARETTHPTDVGHVVVLDSEIVNINVEGTKESYHRRILKVTGEAGKRELDYVSAWAQGGDVRVEKARLIRADGTEAAVPIRWGGVDPPPLEIGDILDFEYRATDVSQTFFGDYYGRTEYFGGAQPIMEKRLVTVFPKERRFFVSQTEGVPEPTVNTDEKGRTVRRWVARDLPKVDPEPMMPSYDEILPALKISSYASWKDFSHWYYNLVRRQHEASPDLAAKVRELTKGLETQEEKVRAVYNFVVTDIRYVAWEFGIHGYKPYKAAVIFSRKFGDCKDKAILLNTMLKEIDVPSEMVLINGNPRRSRENFTLPLIGNFNHCISRVTLSDGRVFFADGTASFHGLTDLPDFDKGARVLVVGERDGHMETIPYTPARDNQSRRLATVTLNADGSAVLEASVNEHGATAAYTRQGYEVPEQRKTRLEEMLGAVYGGTRIQRVEISDLKDLNIPVKYGFTARIPSFAKTSGNTLRFKPAFDQQRFSQFATLSRRKYDIILGPPKSIVQTMTYLVPEGWEVRTLPESMEMDTPALRYALRITRESGAVVATREITWKKNRVTTAEYPEFRALAGRVDQAERREVVLRRK